MDDDVRKSIHESLQRKYGNIVRLQSHDVPEWLGNVWLVSFELHGAPQEGKRVVRAALFNDESGGPVLAREIVIRDADENYPPWKPLADHSAKLVR